MTMTNRNRKARRPPPPAAAATAALLFAAATLSPPSLAFAPPARARSREAGAAGAGVGEAGPARGAGRRAVPPPLASTVPAGVNLPTELPDSLDDAAAIAANVSIIFSRRMESGVRLEPAPSQLGIAQKSQVVVAADVFGQEEQRSRRRGEPSARCVRVDVLERRKENDPRIEQRWKEGVRVW
ncbi:hypothetical protein ACHAWF_012464 [Thalassiosira exigua]